MLLHSTVINTLLLHISCGELPVHPPKVNLKSKRASQRLPTTTAQRALVRSESPRTRPLLQPLTNPQHFTKETPCLRKRASRTTLTQMELSTLKRPKVRAHLPLKADPWVSRWKGSTGSAFTSPWTWKLEFSPVSQWIAQVGLDCHPTVSRAWWAPRTVQKLKENVWWRKNRTEVIKPRSILMQGL